MENSPAVPVTVAFLLDISAGQAFKTGQKLPCTGMTPALADLLTEANPLNKEKSSVNRSLSRSGGFSSFRQVVNRFAAPCRAGIAEPGTGIGFAGI